MKRVLFISGHPDDHLTSVGFLSLLAKKGYELFEVVLTGGSGGYVSEQDREKIVAVREQEFEAASRLLGMSKTFFLGYDEHTLMMNQENVEELTKIIRAICPEIVIIPNRDDYHETHLETNRIATKAIRTAMKKRKLELGEPVNPSIVLEWEFSVPKQPDIIVDITAEWEIKERVMGCYGSQLTAIEYQKARSLNEYRGAAIGVRFAEGFRVNRFIPVRLERIMSLI